jgi:hypothetical protein
MSECGVDSCLWVEKEKSVIVYCVAVVAVRRCSALLPIHTIQLKLNYIGFSSPSSFRSLSLSLALYIIFMYVKTGK